MADARHRPKADAGLVLWRERNRGRRGTSRNVLSRNAREQEKGVDVPFGVGKGVDVPFGVEKGVDVPFGVGRMVEDQLTSQMDPQMMSLRVHLMHRMTRKVGRRIGRAGMRAQKRKGVAGQVAVVGWVTL